MVDSEGLSVFTAFKVDSVRGDTGVYFLGKNGIFRTSGMIF